MCARQTFYTHLDIEIKVANLLFCTPTIHMYKYMCTDTCALKCTETYIAKVGVGIMATLRIFLIGCCMDDFYALSAHFNNTSTFMTFDVSCKLISKCYCCLSCNKVGKSITVINGVDLIFLLLFFNSCFNYMYFCRDFESTWEMVCGSN